MQALLDSLERGHVLHQQFRGLKESLVTCALKVHVANRMIDDDGTSMDFLRKQAVQSKTRYLEAEKRAKAAAEIVQELTVEISILKKAVTGPNLGNRKVSQTTATGNGTDEQDAQADEHNIKAKMLKVFTGGGMEGFQKGVLNSVKLAQRRPSSSPSGGKYRGSQDQLSHEREISGWNQDFPTNVGFNESDPHDQQRLQGSTSSSSALSRYNSVCSYNRIVTIRSTYLILIQFHFPCYNKLVVVLLLILTSTFLLL